MLADDGAQEFRVEELAQRCGMTVRNIREHQSRGLLPPPTVRGRVGYYGPAHLARLELIKRLQADGFTLESIRRMLERSGGAMLRFAATVHETFEARPRVVTAGELARVWQTEDPASLTRAAELGLLTPLPDGRYEERNPRLTAIGAELVALGVPAARAIEAAGEALMRARQMAEVFVRLYVETFWEPFDAAGRPPERWQELLDPLERLRPLALEAAVELFGVGMDEATTRALTRHGET